MPAEVTGWEIAEVSRPLRPSLLLAALLHILPLNFLAFFFPYIGHRLVFGWRKLVRGDRVYPPSFLG
jgi:hypothetical protein